MSRMLHVYGLLFLLMSFGVLLGQESGMSRIGHVSSNIIPVENYQATTPEIESNAIPGRDGVFIGLGTNEQRQPIRTYWGYERSAAIHNASEIGFTCP